MTTSVESLQVCDEQDAGCDSIIHVIHTIYNDQTCETVLINRNVFLHNITIKSLTIVIYVMNCCSTHSRLFIIGANETRSFAGTTQGDPVAMAVFASFQ